MRLGVAALAVLSLAAAACGDDDDDGDSGSQTTASSTGSQPDATTGTSGPGATADSVPSDMDPNGILKYAARLISSLQQVHFDPVQSICVCTVRYDELIFGTLLREQADGSLAPWMAETVEVVDPQTVRITLRPDITFTDGAAYDAEAVKAGLLRTRFESATPQVAAQLHVGMQALASVDVIDPLTVEAHLDKPIAAVFLESLAGMGGVIVSPKQVAENPAEVDTKPVGAGPYVMQKYDIDQLIEYRKNPDFWDADSWRLAGIDFVQAPVGPPRVNGLLADAVDLAEELPISGLAPLEADSEIEVDTSGRQYSAILLCHKPPFDNLAVRQAISVAIDRDEYNELLFGGLGEPAYGVFPEGHPSYDPELAQRLAHDPDEAKKILSDANLSNVSFDLWSVSQSATEPHAEVLQAQLKEVGITTSIIVSENIYGEWIQPQKPGGLITPLGGIGNYVLLSNEVSKGGAQAYCGIDGSDVMAKAAEAAALDPSDPKAIEAMAEANRLYVESAYHIPVLFEPRAAALNTARVGGEMRYTLNERRPDFSTLYMKKK